MVSLQSTWITVDRIEDAVIVHRGSRRLVGIVEVSGLPFASRTEREQEEVLVGYRSLLMSLDAPIQILIQIRRVPASPLVSHHADLADLSPALARLRATYIAWFAEQMQTRVVLTRRFFLVMAVAAAGRVPFDLPWARRVPLAHDRHPLAALVGQLDVRCEGVARACARVGLGATRLAGDQLRDVLRYAYAPQVEVLHGSTP